MTWTMILFALTLVRPAAAVPDVSGSWAISGELNGDINSGTLDKAGTTMSGKASLGGVGEGTFTAKKQKK